ncbi:MAG TPA: ATP-binding protein [Frankiaceae bacterium]|nr:ATP-binding protein [Frankiaceae bacterium]
MPEPVAARARRVLLALGDLAPAGERTDATLVVTERATWLPMTALSLFAADETTRVTIDYEAAERLAALDQIRADGGVIRAGWLFVTGRVLTERGLRRVLHPLVEVPVRIRRGAITRPWVAPAGDAELTSLVPDGDERRRLEERLDDLGLAWTPDAEEWARAAARAAGFDVTRVLEPGTAPDRAKGTALALLPSVAVYAVRDVEPTRRAGSLREWSARPGIHDTAFAAIYAGAAPERAPVTDAPESPYPLNAAQRRAVAAARDRVVSVVSGAPGTGKSQTVVAIACDALARGETVLVAARSDAAVDALLDLLERAPGPEPVVFGSNERRIALATRLAAGLTEVPRRLVAGATHELSKATGYRDIVRRSLDDRLRAHLLVTGDPDLVALRDAAPGLFGFAPDLERFDRALQRAGERGWLARRHAAKARAVAGAAASVSLADLAAARGLARVAADAAVETAGAPLAKTGDYAALVAATDAVRKAAGRWLAATTHAEMKRLDPRARASVSALATALRSGRGRRREQLARLDHSLTRALPIWVGSLPDIDDLLPHVAGLFDLVVLDEASSIDQPLAAPALLRARRAVVVGDPKQLRHVSFLGDGELSTVLAAQRLDDDPLLSALLDVRRNSTFDVAAAVAPVLTLDEHHRSRPHLVDLVARRVYGGAFAVAHRSPLTEGVDCIHAERIEGRRNAVGAVPAEVERVVALLRERLAAGVPSVGVVTPFRPQSDALEAAVLAEFTADELQALNLRVGTVHAFQGNERDDVIVSLGIGPREKAASWRFVDDPHLFAVLTTRARTDLTLVYSADPPARGLVAAYLAQADTPPGRPRDGGVSEWATALACELRRGGADIVTGYPAGRHVVDICWYGLDRPLALVTDVHPLGVDAHVERAEALVRIGWRVVEAFQRPMATPERVAVELLARLAPQ